MAFIDELNIYAEAGRGGDGVVRWRHEKFIEKGGPSGGDGGRGGDFYVLAVRDVGRLASYKHKKEFIAERGVDGGNKSLHGANGVDYVLELPIGSVITNLDTEARYELNEAGEKILLLKGGYGGYGNEHFKSSTNTTPEERNEGQDGEKANFHIELELFADIGLVGLPNAGKSSLLNAITNAKSKIGSYQFTTLEPHLGDFFGFIIADIPGIIEGASEGKGLGTKFLRHIKRTKMLAHLVSLENDEPMKVYKEIRAELEAYDKKNNLVGDEKGTGLSEKEEIIILTKTDMIEDKKSIEKIKKEFAKLKKQIFTLSLYDDASVEEFKKELSVILNSK